ncbi:hypothetical protein [Leucobacter manosquensis]|uniref:Uncharacterized protein n=1 Tax=Leucobacter manosquensis TaxID=2810611 RepID=A0ABS5M5A7_9MICO|nr:hypothetical protein [Leucobacter manosquensis]MBS3182377.1 hypothetical protein [Leucobacter manosquensis]
MKRRFSKATVLYSLAAALLAGAVVNAAPSTATSSEATLYIDQLAVQSPRYYVQQWGYMRTMGSSTPAVSYRHNGWDNATGIYAFSIGLRDTSGNQFARKDITAPTWNYGANYTIHNGYGITGKKPFYLNTRWDKAAGGAPALRTFYGELHWQGP